MDIFYSSPWIPVEWIAAHGFNPQLAGLAPTGRPAIAPEGVCSFAQELQTLAKTHSDTPVIFTTACDQMRRAADAASTSMRSRLFLFNLPATWQTSAARNLYRAEIERLGLFLETQGGCHPDAGTLEAVMREQDERRQRLRAVSHYSTRERAAALACFCGALVTQTSRSVAPRVLGCSTAEGKEGSEPARACAPKSRGASTGNASVPIALIGGPLTVAQWDLFDAIEAAGGSIVVNATEPGERCLFAPLPHRLADPVTALADYYFDNITDVFQRPNTRLYDWLGAALKEGRARGIILWVHVGCDLWRVEAASLREAFGLPLLVLEAHDAPGSSRNVNRIAALVESLQ